MRVRTQGSGKMLEPGMLEMQGRAMNDTTRGLSNWTTTSTPAGMPHTTFKREVDCYLPTLKGLQSFSLDECHWLHPAVHSFPYGPTGSSMETLKTARAGARCLGSLFWPCQVASNRN